MYFSKSSRSEDGSASVLGFDWFGEGLLRGGHLRRSGRLGDVRHIQFSFCDLVLCVFGLGPVITIVRISVQKFRV